MARPDADPTAPTPRDPSEATAADGRGSTGTPPAPSDADAARAWRVLADVPDPEIPVLSVVDLGIVRRLEADAQRVELDVTPTYTGCPAVEVIEQQIELALRRHGWREVKLRRCLSPPWTTDWISEQGLAKLAAYGIAPPPRLAAANHAPPPCPACGATATQRLSEFGSTPCKAMYRCGECLEPFEHFKCL